MPNTKPSNWSEYYNVTRSNPPSKLLMRALEFVQPPGNAIDIGGGALKDTRHLLNLGFSVTVIDQDPLLREEVKNLSQEKLQYFVTSYEDFDFPVAEYDLASAMSALPFNPAASFNQVFDRIKKSLKPDGIFCGQFFGTHDAWCGVRTQMTFHTKEQVEELLADMEILYLSEEEKDGQTAIGQAKHWHIIHVIAKQP